MSKVVMVVSLAVNSRSSTSSRYFLKTFASASESQHDTKVRERVERLVESLKGGESGPSSKSLSL